MNTLFIGTVLDNSKHYYIPYVSVFCHMPKIVTVSLRPVSWRGNCGTQEMPGPFLRSALFRQELSCLYLSFLLGSWNGARQKPVFPHSELPPGCFMQVSEQQPRSLNLAILNCFRQIPQSLSVTWIWGRSGPGHRPLVLGGTIPCPLQHTSSSEPLLAEGEAESLALHTGWVLLFLTSRRQSLSVHQHRDWQTTATNRETEGAFPWLWTPAFLFIWSCSLLFGSFSHLSGLSLLVKRGVFKNKRDGNSFWSVCPLNCIKPRQTDCSLGAQKYLTYCPCYYPLESLLCFVVFGMSDV